VIIFGVETKLFAVAALEGNYCPTCAEKKWGKDLENMSDEFGNEVIVTEADDWKDRLAGSLCVGKCGKLIGD
jgi:hypothetical protein